MELVGWQRMRMSFAELRGLIPLKKYEMSKYELHFTNFTILRATIFNHFTNFLGGAWSL